MSHENHNIPGMTIIDLTAVDHSDELEHKRAMAYAHQRTHEMVVTLYGSVTSLSEKVSKHIEEEPTEIRQAIKEAMDNAFEEGNPTRHKSWHEGRTKLSNNVGKLVFKVFEMGTVLLAGWLGMALWQAFKSEVTK